MSEVFSALKGDLYCGGNIRMKDGEEGGTAVVNGAVGGCVGLVERGTLEQRLDWERKDIPGGGNRSPAR